VNRANATLFAAFFHFDMLFVVWVILGPLALFIAKDRDLSLAQKAFLVSIPPLGGAFFRVFFGYFSDRYGSKRAKVRVPIVR
jgi:NNP family nitrate/nitrite transporter-like MFS transporter